MRGKRIRKQRRKGVENSSGKGEIEKWKKENRKGRRSDRGVGKIGSKRRRICRRRGIEVKKGTPAEAGR